MCSLLNQRCLCWGLTEELDFERSPSVGPTWIQWQVSASVPWGLTSALLTQFLFLFYKPVPFYSSFSLCSDKPLAAVCKCHSYKKIILRCFLKELFFWGFFFFFFFFFKSWLTKCTLKGSLGRGLLFFNLSGGHLKTEQVSGNWLDLLDG